MTKRVHLRRLFVLIFLGAAVMLTACTKPVPDQAEALGWTAETDVPPLDEQPDEGPAPTVDTMMQSELLTGGATETPVPEEELRNPLTGEPVENPEVLFIRPLLVSVSNFPVSARPQAGLSAAAQVWETFIGEGMTRFLAVFYGDYSTYLQAILANQLVEGSGDGFVIGPVRSGRVVFEDIKTLFEGAMLITAGASPEVAEQLTGRVSVYGDDDGNINSTGVDVDDLGMVGSSQIDPSRYATLAFDPSPPEGGESADFFRIVYNFFNQIGWEFSPEQGAYLRSQDLADGSGELFPAVERLTGEQLAFDNVLVLWAQHRYVTPTIIEMQLVYVWDQRGLLFRDGRVYSVLWSSRSGEFRVYDAEGNLVPLKPGSTFVEVVSWETTWDPEAMIVRYHNPPQP
ncbi:MAG: DUF3048 C-terminal domain-containing protein [Anaerolineales bacterium]|nr:DUF3048 C-terminal domain-containing protein [Anaerolineales bacterium]